MIYTITFNPALDYVMKVGALKLDGINRSDSEAMYYGGKGINVSAVLTRLGVENTALGFVAGFTGKELERLVNADKIKTDFVYLESGMTRINVKIKAESELDINANGAEISGDDIERLMQKLSGIKEGDYLVLSGSLPPSLPTDTYEIILERLSGRGVKFVIDAEGELLLNTLKFKPFLIKPNHFELGGLFGVTINTAGEVKKYARRLQEKGAQNVIVSLAEKGAVLIDSDGIEHEIKNAGGKLVNSTGCGDSMIAGFLAGCVWNKSCKEALKLGIACANATAYSNGLADKKEIDIYYSKL